MKTRIFLPLLVVWPALMGPACAPTVTWDPNTIWNPDGNTNTSNDGSCATPANLDSWRAQVVALVNQERAAYGLGAITLNGQLNQAAQDFCCAMLEGDFFPADHINPDTGEGPEDRIEATGYEWRSVGENIARGHTSPQEVVTAWMNSPGHQQVILGEFHTEAGVGICSGGAYGLHWVLDMASPLWP